MANTSHVAQLWRILRTEGKQQQNKAEDAAGFLVKWCQDPEGASLLLSQQQLCSKSLRRPGEKSGVSTKVISKDLPKIMHLKEQALVQRLGRGRDAASPITAPEFKSWLRCCSGFLQTHRGTQQPWLQHLGPSDPCARPGLNPGLLALAWPCPNLSGHLGSEPVGGTSVSPFLK